MHSGDPCSQLIDDPCPSVSDIDQLDGNDSVVSDSLSDDSLSDDSFLNYDTDDEVDPILDPAVLAPVPNQVPVQGQPVQLEVVADVSAQPSPLPLCMMLNARSLYNKAANFKTLFHQISSEITIVSETWERQNQTLENLICSENFKVISYKRPKPGKGQPGGGCAIIYNDNRYKVTRLEIPVPNGVEAAWALFTPVSSTAHHKVKKIARNLLCHP